MLEKLKAKLIKRKNVLITPGKKGTLATEITSVTFL